MKMFISIVGFFFCSCTIPISKYYIKPVMDDYFKEDVINGIKKDTTTLYRKNQIVNIQESKLLFPYKEFDELRVYKFNSEDRKKEFVRNLDSISAQKLLMFFNNPNNFGIAECGTPIPEAVFEFYFDNKLVGEVLISCNNKYAEWRPEHTSISFGEIINDSLVVALIH